MTFSTEPAVATRTESIASSRFARLAGWSMRHRWWALTAWIVVLIGVSAGSQAVGSDYHNDFSLPGTESQRAFDALRRHAPATAGDTLQVVVEDPAGVAREPTRGRVLAMLAELRGRPHVVSVFDMYSDPSTVSRDGTIGYATVTLDARAEDVPIADVREMIATVRTVQRDGVRAALGGEAVRAAEEAEGGAAEGAGLLAALVVLVLLFGSLLAASLPVFMAIFAVGTTLGLIALASHVANIADFTPPLMMLVGLGVGIDYALLIFFRFRSELMAGTSRDDAGRIALDTAGRTVFFAGATVIVALLGLAALGLGSLQGVALAVALTVLITMIASLTLLPALLAIFGRRIERRAHRRAERRKRPEGERWGRWSGAVQRRPLLALALALIALLALSFPMLNMRLGFTDAGSDAPSNSSRQAFDLLVKGFGPGFNGPLLIVVEGDERAADALTGALDAADGVAAHSPPLPLGDGRGYTVIAFPDSAPQDRDTSALVSRLREDVLPPLERRTGATYLVGGTTAAYEDFSDTVFRRLPIFVGIVVGLSALLLLLVFRSVLIPIKAALLNLLSISAALGFVTLVFQDGAFGVEPGPIEAFVPVMIFAIVFGLSMDYEMFLLSRMHEHWRRSGDAPAAIRQGIATTGQVVTAAATIMVVVFGAFLLSPERFLQQFGLGLAVAILIDAAVIRCLMVPAVMHLFGTRAWWLPGWLGRLLPSVAVEPESAGVPVQANGVGRGSA